MVITKMSQWSEEFCDQHRDVDAVRKQTKEVLKSGKNLAFSEYHDTMNFKKLERGLLE